MATINWIAGSGDWNTPGNWSSDTVPGAADDAVLAASGSYTVTANGIAITVAQLDVNPAATVQVNGGSLTIAGPSQIDGTLIENGATVAANGNMNVNNLTLEYYTGALTGSGTVTVTGALNWTSGDMSGTGATIVAAGATAAITSNVNLDRELDIAGQATLGTSGSGNQAIQLGLSGFVKTLAGGSLTMWGSVPGFGGNGINNGGGSVENAGTMVAEGTGSTTTINVAVTNDAAGTVDVQSGTLDLAGGGSSLGTLQAEAGATLEFGGGSFALAAGSQLNIAGNLTVNNDTLTTNPAGEVSVAGSVTVHLDAFGSSTLNLDNAITPANVTVDGGTLNANAALTTSSLNVSGHGTSFGFFVTPTLAGSGTVTVTNSMNWTSGNMSGTGTTILAGGGTAAVTGNVSLAREFDIAGQLTLGTSGSGNSSIQLGSSGASGVVKVLSGGSLAMWGSVPGFGGNGIFNGGGGSVENAGTIVAEGAGSTAASNVAVDNTGEAGQLATIDVGSGTLDLTAGGTDTYASYIGSGTIQFGGGARTLDANSSIGQTNVLFSGGTTTVNGSYNALSTDVSGGTANLSGTIAGLGPTTVSGGTLNITVMAAPSTWTGAISVSGNGLVEFGGTSQINTIGSGGSISISGQNAFIAAAGPGTTSNTTLALTSNAGTLTLQNGAALTTPGSLANSGTLDLYGGTLHVAAAAPSTWTGTVNISGNGLLEYDGASGIAAIASGASINIETSQGFIAAAGLGTASNTALTALTSIAGNLTLQDGAAVTTTSGLTNSGNLLVDNAGSGGSSLSIGGTLVNSNVVQIGDGSSTPAAVTVQGLSNAGTTDVNGGAVLADTGSLTDSGTINVAAKGLLVVSGPLADQGTINLAGGALTSNTNGALTIAAGGTLSGYGTVSVAVTNNGTIAASGGILDIAAPISGSGQLSVATGATLELGNSSTETMSFGGNVGTYKLDAPSRVSGAFTGLVIGDVIDLAGIAATDAAIVGSTLVVTTTGSQTFTWQVAGALAGNSFTIQSDGHGGSDLVLGSGTSAAAYQNFYPAVDALGADLQDGAPPGQVPADALNVYMTAVAGAIGTIGGSAWQQAYQVSGIAAGALVADVAEAGSTQQILSDTLGLYNTIVDGAVGSIAENASPSSYSTIVQAAGALGTDIAASAGDGQLQSDLSNLYNALAGGAIGNTSWQQAESASDQAAATLSTDMTNGAGRGQIQSDVAALYDTIVSGSLDAIGGASLQHAYQNGAHTVLTLGADISKGAGSAQIQTDVAGLYNAIVSPVASGAAGAATTQAYSATIAAADSLAGDITNRRSGLFATDAFGLLELSLAGPVNASAGANAGQAYTDTVSTLVTFAGAAARGASTQDLINIAIPLTTKLLGPVSGSAWQQWSLGVSQALNTALPGIAQGGVAANNAALQLYTTMLEDLLGAQIVTSGVINNPDLTAAQTLATDSNSGNSALVPGDLSALIGAIIAADPGGGDITQFQQDMANALSQYAKSTVSTVYSQVMGEAIAGVGIPAFSTAMGLPGIGFGATAEIGGAAAAIPAIMAFGFAIGNAIENYVGPNTPLGQALATPGTYLGNVAAAAVTGITGLLLTPIPGSNPPGGGTAQGDVHLTTYDGLYYNFQAAGEFVLTQSTQPGNSFQIQTRLQPLDGSSSVTVMTMIGAAVGTDRVTFGIDRASTVMVNGAAVPTLAIGSPIALSGGRLSELAPNIYQITWNTGETATITNQGSYFNISETLGSSDGPGSVQGLLGPDEGQAYDFQLANGTVLQQPLTSAELYGEYANAWRVTQATSLLDYGSGQTTATLTNSNFPAGVVTTSVLTQVLPQNLVAQAAQLATAAGITDPNVLAGAELDYLATGDTSFLTGAANSQQPGGTTAANITVSTPPPPLLGVDAEQIVYKDPPPTDTIATFPVYLTSATTSDTVLDWAVIAPNPSDLGAAAFGGTLPSGQVTIPAGQTSAQFTVDVPAGALGNQPSGIVEVQISSPNDPVFAATAQTTIFSGTPVAGPTAVAQLALLTNVGTLTHNGNDYSLNLGTVVQGEALPVLQFALVNAATAPADSLDGTFGTPSGVGFAVVGASLPTAIAAGQSYNGLEVTVETGVIGANQETIVFNPQDTNISGYSASLPTLTLTITDNSGLPAVAAVNTPTSISFSNVRVGGADSQTVSVTNSAGAGAASLDASLSLFGNATGSGTISELAPGATNATALSVGLDTSAGGLATGLAAINFIADAGNGVTAALPSQTIAVSGAVYRPAAAFIPALVAHVGDSAMQVSITNSGPADGYSENLIASVVGTTGGITATGTTGDIAPQATSNAITLGLPAASAGTVGTVTLDFTTDGTGIDGLGTKDLGQQTYSVSLNNYAQAAFEEVSGGGTLTQNGNAYSLDLGTLTQGSGPATIDLGVLNSAVGPADNLAGSFTIAGDSAFTNSGFGAFSGIAAGQADSAPTVTLAATTAGTFSETITLSPVDASGAANQPLASETLTITGNVVPQLAGQISLASATEGSALPGTTTVATFTDTNAGDTAGSFTAAITWGDGTTTTGTVTGANGSFAVSGGHTYADEGSSPLTAIITDTANSTTLTLNGTVATAEGDVLTPQSLTFTANPGQFFSGTVATFTDSNTTNVASDFSAAINWGDGTTTTGVITDNAGAISVSGTHNYASEGQDTVTVSVTDDAPGTAAASAISTANVVQPFGNINGQINLTAATEGATLPPTTTVATFSNTDTSETAGAFTASINWGDGTTTTGTVTGANGSFTVSGGHTYTDEGNDTVAVTITRTADGTQIAPSGALTVSDAALAAAGVSVAATEGASTGATTVATFTDANPNAVASDFAATINWGDGTSSAGTVSANTGGGFSVNGAHSYADEGKYTIGVAIADIGGSTASATSMATVSDAALAATGVNVTAAEGASTGAATVATLTDSNPNAVASNFTAAITWGDGTSSVGTVSANAGGGFSVAGPHTYKDEGQYTIGVAITDIGGSTASATSTATVADAALAAAGVSVAATEGASTGATTVATFTDANPNTAASDFTATINWGDGTSSAGTVSANAGGGFSVNGAHSYAGEGKYTIGVAIADIGGSTASATSKATVSDAALAATGVNVTAAEGASTGAATVATFTDANPNAVASDFTATVNWGDGTTSVGTVSANAGGGFSVNGAHSYADEGKYTVGVAITDIGGSTASATSTATVTDAALAAAGVAVGATEGASTGAATVATFTDANPNAAASNFTATINWSDGTTSVGTVSANAGGGFAVNGAHSYADEGQYTVGVAIADIGGSTASATSTATVADAALAAAGVSLAATEGLSTGATKVATFTDANPSAAASNFTATINWGDGTSSVGTVSANAGGGFSVVGPHTYKDEGKYTVGVAITDIGGSTASATSTATVTDAALAAAGVAVGATEGASTGAATVATFTDANPNAVASDFTATINWGDGTTSVGTVVANGTGGFGVNGAHSYADEGKYTIGVAITDIGGSTASATSTATVAEGDLLTAHAVTFSANAGQAFTGTVATFSDADTLNVAGDFTATINWGDGTTTSGIVADTAGTISVSGTHAYTTSGQDAVTVILTDDAPGTATATAISTANVASTANAPPVITAPASVIIQQNQASKVTGVSIADADAVSAQEKITVTLTDTKGLLSAQTSAQGGGGTITGAGTTHLAIMGTLTQVNADLATLTDLQSTSNSSATDKITINANDGRGGNAVPRSIAVDVNAPPIIDAARSVTVKQGQASAVNGVSVSDTDAVSANEKITVSLTDTYGMLSATTHAAGGGGTISGNGTANLTVSGTLAQVNADLTTLTDRESSSKSDKIIVNANDSRGGTASPQTIFVGHETILTGKNYNSGGWPSEPVTYPGPISGFGPGDELDLSDFRYGQNTTLGYSANSGYGVLTVQNGAEAANIILLGNYMASAFAVSSDGAGGTCIADLTPNSSQQTLVTPPSHT